MMSSVSTDAAVGRKGTMAVYHALRAHITRFEGAFVQLHGRRPQGAREKAPMATMYAQYREWKRFIRANAAMRIQALVRGASIRIRILRNDKSKYIHYDPQLFKLLGRLLAKRARRHDCSGIIRDLDATFELVVEIRAPAESIGNHRRQDGNWSSSNRERDDPSIDVSTTIPLVEGTDPTMITSASLRRDSNNYRNDESTSSYDDDDDSPIIIPSQDDLARLSLQELQARKREIKDQLLHYDLRFTIEHGRMPDKEDKEPIRYLYNEYNALKGQIAYSKTLALVSNY